MHLLSFIRGALFGGFIVYLFAPRSGEETRRMITQKGDDLKNVVQNTFGDIVSSVSDEVTPQRNAQPEDLPYASNSYKPMTYQQQ